MTWDYDSILSKAKLYIHRAFADEERESELFPFWCTIGLEFLGRAVLSNVHPTLLADPQHPESVLYACGFAGLRIPSMPGPFQQKPSLPGAK